MSKQPTNLFEFEDFRDIIRNHAVERGRGELRKVANFVGVHTTLLSQILSGRKCLTEEQALKLCTYLELGDLQRDFLLKLVQIERAGSTELKLVYKQNLFEIREQAKELRRRVPKAKGLSERDRAIFYSSWQYAAIRLATSIPKLQTPGALAQRFDLPVARVQEILEFLVSRGLCRDNHGRFERTERNTHVEARASLVVRHHQNWRAKAIELTEDARATGLTFTAPVVLSKSDFPKVKAILAETVAIISELIEASPNEELAYLGIDWMVLPDKS